MLGSHYIPMSPAEMIFWGIEAIAAIVFVVGWFFVRFHNELH